MHRKVNGRESIDPFFITQRSMSDSLHAAKKCKTATAGPPLYSELDLAQLTVDATLLGANETRFATVKYKDTRLVYQLAGVGEAMRVPFGIDDGSKFGSKASMSSSCRTRSSRSCAPSRTR